MRASWPLASLRERLGEHLASSCLSLATPSDQPQPLNLAGGLRRATWPPSRTDLRDDWLPFCDRIPSTLRWPIGSAASIFINRRPPTSPVVTNSIAARQRSPQGATSIIAVHVSHAGQRNAIGLVRKELHIYNEPFVGTFSTIGQLRPIRSCSRPPAQSTRCAQTTAVSSDKRKNGVHAGRHAAPPEDAAPSCAQPVPCPLRSPAPSRRERQRRERHCLAVVLT